MNSNYLVIHGSFGSPFINWFPWFYDELTKKDKQVLIPQFPIGLELQNYDNWKMLLDYYRDIGFLTNETIVFAHSIGAIFIVKYLLENNIKVNKLVLVSGFNNYSVDNGGDYDKVNSSFFVSDISKIKDLTKEIICIYSDNDSYLKKEAVLDFADKVATKQVLIKGGGHLNSEAGYNSFEELLKYI